MRLKLTAPLQSRDGTLDKGGLMKNCLAEIDGDVFRAKKRPGISAFTGTFDLALQGADWMYSELYSTNILMMMRADAFSAIDADRIAISLVSSTTLTGVASVSSDNRWKFAFGDAGSGSQKFIVKTQRDAYYGTGANPLPVRITDADYPGWNIVNVTSIVRAGSVATVTTASTTNFRNLSTITISGADQSAYNGAVKITVTSPTTFTYEVSGTPASPATGTIYATGGVETVPGSVYLDGYFFVMDVFGTIYNSALEDPASWNSLDFISCEAEPDKGVGIAKFNNYVVAFGEWTTEFFYDAANANGSPLALVQNATQQIGCWSGTSIAQFDNSVVFVGKTKEAGLGIYSLSSGFAPQKISNTDVDRLLNKVAKILYSPDFSYAVSNVYAYGTYISGHPCYVLSVVDNNDSTNGFTICYDFASQAWSVFTRGAVPTSGIAITSLSQADGVATVTKASHGLSDGDVVTIAGATPSGYNGTFNISYIDANNFSFLVPATTSTPASVNGTYTKYPDSSWDLHMYVSCPNGGLFLDTSGGLAYKLSETAYKDSSKTGGGTSTIINTLIRTIPYDAATGKRKSVSSAEVIGDKVASSTALLRYSDDDYTTNSKYRPIDMSVNRSRLHRLGSFSRRSFEIRHTADTSFRVEALEIEGD